MINVRASHTFILSSLLLSFVLLVMLQRCASEGEFYIGGST